MQLKYFTEEADRHPPAATLWDDVDRSKKPQHDAAFWEQKSLVEAGALATSLGNLGNGQDDADFALLRMARDVQLAGLPRAQEIMDYFLSGSAGRPGGRRNKLVFKIKNLLTRCPGACAHVAAEIRTRIHHAAATSSRYRFGDVYAQWGDDPRKTPTAYNEFEFPIGQGNYKDRDWQNALGTLFCIWVPYRSEATPQHAGAITAIQDRKPAGAGSTAAHALPALAIVGGKRVWGWHSKTDRASEAVHQAGARLVKKGRLFNFHLEAEPCVWDITKAWPLYDAGPEMLHR